VLNPRIRWLINYQAGKAIYTIARSSLITIANKSSIKLPLISTSIPIRAGKPGIIKSVVNAADLFAFVVMIKKEAMLIGKRPIMSSNQSELLLLITALLLILRTLLLILRTFACLHSMSKLMIS
jgi:hypothetical protein